MKNFAKPALKRLIKFFAPAVRLTAIRDCAKFKKLKEIAKFRKYYRFKVTIAIG